MGGRGSVCFLDPGRAGRQHGRLRWVLLCDTQAVRLTKSRGDAGLDALLLAGDRTDGQQGVLGSEGGQDDVAAAHQRDGVHLQRPGSAEHPSPLALFWCTLMRQEWCGLRLPLGPYPAERRTALHCTMLCSHKPYKQEQQQLSPSSRQQGPLTANTSTRWNMGAKWPHTSPRFSFISARQGRAEGSGGGLSKGGRRASGHAGGLRRARPAVLKNQPPGLLHRQQAGRQLADQGMPQPRNAGLPSAGLPSGWSWPSAALAEACPPPTPAHP